MTSCSASVVSVSVRSVGIGERCIGRQQICRGGRRGPGWVRTEEPADRPCREVGSYKLACKTHPGWSLTLTDPNLVTSPSP